MPTAISEAQFHSDLILVHDAISDQQWATAYRYLAMAEVIHAGLMFQKSGDGGSESRRNDLKAVREAVDQAKIEALRNNEKRFIKSYTGHPDPNLGFSKEQ